MSRGEGGNYRVLEVGRRHLNRKHGNLNLESLSLCPQTLKPMWVAIPKLHTDNCPLKLSGLRQCAAPEAHWLARSLKRRQELCAQSFDKLPQSEDFELSAAQANHVTERAFKKTSADVCKERPASALISENLCSPLIILPSPIHIIYVHTCIHTSMLMCLALLGTSLRKLKPSSLALTPLPPTRQILVNPLKPRRRSPVTKQTLKTAKPQVVGAN